MSEVNVAELEVGVSTEYGMVADMVYVSDAEVVVNFVDDFFDNNYDPGDSNTFEQFEFDADDTVFID